MNHKAEEDIEECVHLTPVLRRTLCQLLNHVHEEADANRGGTLCPAHPLLSIIVDELFFECFHFLRHGSFFLNFLQLTEGELENTGEVALRVLSSALEKYFPEGL